MSRADLMNEPRHVSGSRGALVVATALLFTAGVCRLFWMAGSGPVAALAATGPDSAADLLVVGACALGAALAAWLGVTVVLSTMAELPGSLGRLAAGMAGRVAPRAVRGAVALALGTALTAGLPTLARAETPSPGPVAASVAPARGPDPAFVVTGAPTPAPAAPRTAFAAATAGPAGAPDPAFSASTAPPPSPPPSPRPAPGLGPLGPATGDRPTPSGAAVTQVRVQPGDSLWRIAAHRLGSHATASQIASEWPRWYAANRAVIGADPDHIQVGQVLATPSAATDGATS